MHRGAKRLLLTGGSGFLGWNVCRVARKELEPGSEIPWEIHGIVHSRCVDMEGVHIRQADLSRYDELKRLFAEIQPDALIHTAAMSNANFCQQHREETWKINVDAAINMAGLCADRGIPCVFTSSDLVFDGLNPPYREDDPVCPVNAYGEQKVMAERGMADRYPAVAVCRMPLMFGDAGPVAQSFIQPMIQAMREGRELKLFTDEFRTPVSGRAAARGLMLALEKVRGIIHLGGPERISRYGFGRLLADVLEVRDARLVACTRKDVPMPAPRSADVSLESGRAFALGFSPAPPRDELRWLAASWRIGSEPS